MLKTNTSLIYSISLLVSSAKRSFESLGRLLEKSGDTVKRLLCPKELSLQHSCDIAKALFNKAPVLYLSIDDTLIRKMFSEKMEGADWMFDTKFFRSFIGYRIIVAALSNTKNCIPFNFEYLFSKKILGDTEQVITKLSFIQQSYQLAQKLFPQKPLVLVMDGLFASVEILHWTIENKIKTTVRMHKNRTVIYQNTKQKISKIADLKLKGKQKARTIKVIWNGLSLYITAELRTDKHGTKSVVYLASTYRTRPIKYVHDYKKRWKIEKIFRTSKQYIGLTECFSRKFEVQEKHVAATLLAYSITQLEMKMKNLKTPEDAIKALKLQSWHVINERFIRLGAIFRT